MKAFDTENSVWARFSPEQRGQMEAYSVHYRQFLDTARTERLANKEIIRQAENAGFHPLADFTSLKAGDKVYWDQKGKSVILAVIGSAPIEKGLKIVGSHIDCPRLDVKAMPVVEKNKIVYFKTHYYGGLLKYQWVCLPLSLVGVVYKATAAASTSLSAKTRAIRSCSSMTFCPTWARTRPPRSSLKPSAVKCSCPWLARTAKEKRQNRLS